MTARTVRTALTWAWWLLVPPFLLLVCRLAADRACASAYELLPEATTVPALAWAIAVLCVGGHALLLAAWLVTAVHADRVAPPWAVVRRLWGRQVWMLVTLGVIFGIEYCPVPVWRALGRHLLGCLP